jgi:crotonobetainyl-CoA:carnitine CoA-transferase CaiB-like acyl-CoA transferase
LGPQDITAMRPGIVVATLSAWGHEGPWQKRRGYDSVVQAVTGMAHVSGTAEEPALLPVSALDYVSGNLMAFGVMAALHRRAAVGGSWLVRVSLATTQHWLAEMGLIPDEALRDLPSDVSKQEIAPFMKTAAAPDGLIRYLGPVLSMSGTPPGAGRPPVPLGSHPPEWPNNS